MGETMNEAWAREWCVGVARWRTVRHRWGVRGRRTLVRVAGEAPLGCLREVLGFLSSEAGARGVFVDGKEVGDWAPMGAWYGWPTMALRMIRSRLCPVSFHQSD